MLADSAEAAVRVLEDRYARRVRDAHRAPRRPEARLGPARRRPAHPARSRPDQARVRPGDVGHLPQAHRLSTCQRRHHARNSNRSSVSEVVVTAAVFRCRPASCAGWSRPCWPASGAGRSSRSPSSAASRCGGSTRGTRDRDRPTDVLSFALREPGGRVTGDVYICPWVAAREARARRHPLRQELIRLVVHGTLHALGRDHPEGEERTRSADVAAAGALRGGARVIAMLQLFIAPLLAAALTLWAAWLALAAESDADLPRALSGRAVVGPSAPAPCPATSMSPISRCWCSPAPRPEARWPGGPARRRRAHPLWRSRCGWSGCWAICCPGCWRRSRRS